MRCLKIIRPYFVVCLIFLSMVTAGCSTSFFHSDEIVGSKEVGSRQLAVDEQTGTQAAESTASKTVVVTQADANITAEEKPVINSVVAETKPLEKPVKEKMLADVSVANNSKPSVVKSSVNVVNENQLRSQPVKAVEDEKLEEQSGDGSVLRVVGRATVTTAKGEIRQIAKGSTVNSTDIISTSSRSYVRMKMKDKSYVMIRPDSRLSIDDFKYDENKPKQDKGFYSLLKGGFRSVTGLMKDKKKYRYRTAVATIGIRGTEFSVRVCNFDCYDVDPVPENGFYLEVHDKKVIVSTKAGDFPFTKGQFVYVANSDSPAVLVTDIPDVFDQAGIPSATPDCDQ